MKPTNTDTQQIEREIAGEQAADLASLQAMAMDGQPGQGGAVATTEPEPTGPDLAKELAGLLTMAVATLGPALPSLREIYTEQTTEAAAAAIAAVCNKRGWLQGGMFGEWGEEIACLAVCGPLAVATYKGVTGDLAKAKAAAKAREPARLQGADLEAPVPTGGPGATTVTFGAPAE